MRDSQKTRKQLLNELQETRRQLEELSAEVKRKQAGAQPKQPEEKFYKAFLSSPDIIVISSIADGKYIEVNESFTRVTGYSRQELIGHTVDEFNLFVNPEEQAKMTRLLQEQSSFRNQEFTFRIRSGEIRQWLCSAEIIDLDGETCMIAVATDITERKKMQEALRESEEKFAKAFRASPEIIAITTIKDGKFIDVNDNYTLRTGYSREEIIGNTAMSLGTWANKDDRARMLRILREQGRVPNQEFNFRMKSGEIRTWLLSMEPITIGGEPCLIGIALDITERKRMEQALRESEEKFSAAFHASPNMVIIVDIEKNRILELNDTYANTTGYTREELLNSNIYDIPMWVNPEEMKEMTHLLQTEGKISNKEYSFRKKSGEILLWLCAAERVTIGGRRCTLAVATDITERKKMQEALRESEEKFAKAFRASPEIFTITRLSDGTFLDVNDSFVRINGYTREEAIGRSSLALNLWLRPEDRQRMLKILQQNGRITNEEFGFRTKSGEVRTMLFSAEKIEYAGEPCLLAITNDITDYKQMEAQALEAENLREVARLRTELLANVSHELRTPLASIKGFTTMLMDYDTRLKPLEKREYLETIDKNVDRLVELIEQLLEMSRLGVGMLSIQKTPVDIIRLCHTVIDEARVRASDHNFVLDLPKKLPRINIDGKRIRQVLDNIIDNAIKYSDTDTGISLSARRNGAYLLFTVTDHGSGISEKDMPHVFDRMFHSARGQKSGVPGAGLGLTICKALIEAHGGKIWLESKEGVGTRCFFTLPFDSKSITNRDIRD